jgi:predicted enzyme related to lactoylglutathione lyase
MSSLFRTGCCRLGGRFARAAILGAEQERPRKESPVANLVVHFEIHASEPQRLIDFYTDLFGWRFQQWGEVEYWSVDTGEGSIGNTTGAAGHGINGGLVPRRGPRPELGDPVTGCNLVIGVDDVDGLMRRGVELGGLEALAASDMPGVGRLGYLLDPDGNVFGMISPELSDGTKGMGG